MTRLLLRPASQARRMFVTHNLMRTGYALAKRMLVAITDIGYDIELWYRSFMTSILKLPISQVRYWTSISKFQDLDIEESNCTRLRYQSNHTSIPNIEGFLISEFYFYFEAPWYRSLKLTSMSKLQLRYPSLPISEILRYRISRSYTDNEVLHFNIEVSSIRITKFRTSISKFHVEPGAGPAPRPVFKCIAGIRQIHIKNVVRDVLVVFKSRLVVFVDVSGKSESRVFRTVVLRESHKGLQVGQEFLRETVDGCSIFESCGMGDVLLQPGSAVLLVAVNVATRKYCVLLHVLKRERRLARM